MSYNNKKNINYNIKLSYNNKKNINNNIKLFPIIIKRI